MTFMPLLRDLDPNFFQNVCLVATDMDGTLTRHGQFTPALLQALADLATCNVQVVMVTGRSAGWVHGLVSYLPVAGAIAENGGLFYGKPEAEPDLLVPIGDWLTHRQRLAQMFQVLQQDYPHLRESQDNRFRITDWTFDVHGLSPDDLQHLSDRCQSEGWSFTYSTVQCHIKPDGQDKATSLLRVLDRHFPQVDPARIVTVGDSPNDESLFNRDRFPLSVGVANVLHYVNQLTYKPSYVTQAEEADGFCELVRVITASAW